MRILEALNYMGPNRRSERTAIELLFEIQAAESAAIKLASPTLRADLLSLLSSCGLEPRAQDFPDASRGDPVTGLGELFCDTAIFLQNEAGHRVEFTRVMQGLDSSRYRFIYEREEADTGERAGDLALLMLSNLVPGLEWNPYNEQDTRDIPELVRRFREFAVPLAMSAETLAIIAAARQRDIPVIKLERDPYDLVKGDFRIRPNSLLMLGQSSYQQIIDGTISVTRSARAVPLVFDPQMRRRLLSSLNLPTRFGSPPDFKILLANDEVVARLACNESEIEGGQNSTGGVHPDIIGQARRIARTASVGLLEVTVAAPDIDRPLEQTGGAFVDFQPAPDLETFVKPDITVMQRAARGFVQWLFPPGAKSRIPAVAITGTNGKSTTTTMIAHIMQSAGRKVGVAHTEGVIIDGQRQELDDLSGLRGHYRVFESPEVNMGVFETARGGVIARGFAFDSCDVAVCLNVTEDHLGLQGVHTIEQMAEVKRSIVERARQGAVLNADDPHCIAMLPHISAAEVCLVSMKSGREELVAGYPALRNFCVLEEDADNEWIVFYRQGRRIPVTRVKDVPATFDGVIGFNTCNAMHAIAASHLAGVDAEVISRAIQAFRADPDVLIGRMNFFEGLPFRVLMDYAHNPDGVSRLLEVIRRMPVSGRRIIVFGAAGDRSDESIKDTARPLACLFDHYIPKNYPDLRGREPLEVPILMKEALIEAGVAERAITPIDDELEAVNHGLDTCRDGDFLILLVGRVMMREAWQAVRDFAGRQPES